MTGCRISRVRMKNGGADIRIFEGIPSAIWTFEIDVGTVTVRTSEDMTNERGVWLLTLALESMKNEH